jgi:soluble lytic murein transglycosylase-like protein
MERLSYGFISFFALGIIVVFLSQVIDSRTSLATAQADYENDLLPDDGLPSHRSRLPLAVTKPIYRTPVIFSQTFMGAPLRAPHHNTPGIVRQFIAKNTEAQINTAFPIQNSIVQMQEPLNEIKVIPDKKFFTKTPQKLDYTPHQYCKKYLQQVAEKTGVLPEILWAVAKAESNYKGGPWPWTINVNGKGYYFPSQEKAKKFLKALAPDKKYKVDVGCMQINWGYHGEDFPYLAKMLNPRANITYAAHFLKRLYQETGNWAKAIAAYHSRNQSLGNPYASNVAHQLHTYHK